MPFLPHLVSMEIKLFDNFLKFSSLFGRQSFCCPFISELVTPDQQISINFINGKVNQQGSGFKIGTYQKVLIERTVVKFDFRQCFVNRWGFKCLNVYGQFFDWNRWAFQQRDIQY